MPDNYGPTFGGYVDVTGVIGTTAAGQVAANIVLLKALIPDPTPGTNREGSNPTPDFDAIQPALANQLRLEIDALAAAIAAAPTA